MIGVRILPHSQWYAWYTVACRRVFCRATHPRNPWRARQWSVKIEINRAGSRKSFCRRGENFGGRQGRRSRVYSQLTGAAVASRKRDGVVGFTGRRGASESYQCGDPAAAGQRPLLSTKSTVTVCVRICVAVSSTLL